jgi:hypothetical protein
MPDHAVLPNGMDAALLVVVAFCSFTSHTFIARAFQVENAAKSAAAGYLQVPPPLLNSLIPLFFNLPPIPLLTIYRPTYPFTRCGRAHDC